MPHQTLVEVPELAAHLRAPGWRVVDCRFKLADKAAGAQAFAQATIPGAVYAHLDDDLSGPIAAGTTGRHPLPSREAFAATLSRWGVHPSTQLVAFDDMGGAFAARLWWMMRWVGHRAAAVLDGGLDAWVAAGHALAPGGEPVRATTFTPGESLVGVVDAEAVLAALDDEAVVVFDARSAVRFRGELGANDPVVGHIAGARSAPYADNLGPDGRLLPPEALKERYEALLGGADPARAIGYCGSGVTACHDLLAMTHAGQTTPRLYPGSWSEWINDPRRPRTTGDEGQ